ncbi:unnamed protein product [Mesocestoides corti]|uniref:Zf-C3Hc3H domain-containing protein n=1 Tax=Mesocestoides corti TaxID=53468 RepID=A0A0R3UH96_MESCO|nr:unnamed protein product [Mesocestoides corti]
MRSWSSSFDKNQTSVTTGTTGVCCASGRLPVIVNTCCCQRAVQREVLGRVGCWGDQECMFQHVKKKGAASTGRARRIARRQPRTCMPHRLFSHVVNTAEPHSLFE